MVEISSAPPRHALWPSIVIITVITLSVGGFFSRLAEEYTRYSEHIKLKANASSVAAAFDPNQIASLSGSSFDEGTQSYDILRGQLRRITLSSPHYKSVTLIGMDGEDVYFMVGAKTPDEEGYRPPGKIYPRDTSLIKSVFQNGVGVVDGPTDTETGPRISTHAAIRNNVGDVIAVLGIIHSADEWMTNVNRTLYVSFLITFLLSLLSITLFTVLRQRRHVAAAYREGAANVKTFLEATPDAMIIADDAGNIIQTNDRAFAVLGYQPEGLVGKSLRHLLPVNDYKRLIGLWRDYVRTGHVDVNYSALEFEGIKKDGEVFPLDLRLSRFSSNGQTYSCGTFRDISERKAYDTKISGIREEADAANRAKSHYIAGMSHELRTPLNVIIGYSELMQTQPEYITQDKRAEYLDHVVKSGRHMLELIGNVLDIARVESGEEESNMTRVALPEITGQCLDMVRPLAEFADLSIAICNIPPGTPDVIADPTRLNQVLLNLLSNAVKYNKPGGKVSLSIGSAVDGMVKLSIADTGTGISPEMIDKIFQPFKRAEKPQSVNSGHGIGLNITKSLIESMGGHIGFENNSDQGTTFWIELQAAPALDTPLVQSAP